MTLPINLRISFSVRLLGDLCTRLLSREPGNLKLISTATQTRFKRTDLRMCVCVCNLQRDEDVTGDAETSLILAD